MMKFILVNLGPQIPSYLYENIRWIRRNFPSNELLVIIDDQIHKENLMELEVEVFYYQRKRDVRELLAKLHHDATFRGGFWQLTIDRLFAICDAVVELGLKKTIYIESDVLILPNFPMGAVSKIEKIAWTRYNDKRDVASIIIIPNSSQATQFRADLIKLFESNPTLTDMSALNQLASRRVDSVFLMPTIVDGLENNKLVDESELSRITFLSPEFTSDCRGVFDGAIIGMYLTGQDPHNSYGFTMFLNQDLLKEDESYTDLRNVDFIHQNKRLYLKTQKGEKIEVYNLHIHSKNPEMFTDRVFSNLEIMVDKANQKIPYVQFNSKILYELMKQNLRNRTFLRYLRRFLYFSLQSLESRFKQALGSKIDVKCSQS